MLKRPSLIADPQPIRASEVEDAQAQISAVYSPHSLRVVSTRDRLDVQLRRLTLPTITVGELSHGTEVEITPGKLRTYYHVNVVLEGHTRTTCGRDIKATTPGLAAILSPTEHATMRWSADCRQLAVKINRVALEHDLEAILGRPLDAPLSFEVLMDTTKGQGWSWMATVSSMIEQLTHNPELAEQDLVLRRFESLVIAQLLTGQPHNYAEALVSGSRRAVRPHRIQAVVDLIDADAGQPLTAADLARAAGVSLRSLQDGFGEHLGVTPMTYLRNVRLARAQEDLLACEPGARSPVTEIAYRWGFGHVPRFASQYRERFGESPSDTLRRRRD